MASAEYFKDIFNSTNKNDEGLATIEDTIAALQTNCVKGTQQELKDLLENAAGKTLPQSLSEEEFITIMDEVPSSVINDAITRKIFKTFDADNNGLIDREEIKRFYKEAKQSEIEEDDLNQVMTYLDKNKDGFVDFEEFVAYCSANMMT